ncbi:unnamed protein product [Closterium sp. Naga37s-1]|nr:unnamed protein product [Closterium sp. Naga37s-1]
MSKGILPLLARSLSNLPPLPVARTADTGSGTASDVVAACAVDCADAGTGSPAGLEGAGLGEEGVLDLLARILHHHCRHHWHRTDRRSNYLNRTHCCNHHQAPARECRAAEVKHDGTRKVRSMREASRRDYMRREYLRREGDVLALKYSCLAVWSICYSVDSNCLRAEAAGLLPLLLALLHHHRPSVQVNGSECALFQQNEVDRRVRERGEQGVVGARGVEKDEERRDGEGGGGGGEEREGGEGGEGEEMGRRRSREQGGVEEVGTSEREYSREEEEEGGEEGEEGMEEESEEGEEEEMEEEEMEEEEDEEEEEGEDKEEEEEEGKREEARLYACLTLANLCLVLEGTQCTLEVEGTQEDIQDGSQHALANACHSDVTSATHLSVGKQDTLPSSSYSSPPLTQTRHLLLSSPTLPAISTFLLSSHPESLPLHLIWTTVSPIVRLLRCHVAPVRGLGALLAAAVCKSRGGKDEHGAMFFLEGAVGILMEMAAFEAPQKREEDGAMAEHRAMAISEGAVGVTVRTVEEVGPGGVEREKQEEEQREEQKRAQWEKKRGKKRQEERAEQEGRVRVKAAEFARLALGYLDVPLTKLPSAPTRGTPTSMPCRERPYRGAGEGRGGTRERSSVPGFSEGRSESLPCEERSSSGSSSSSSSSSNNNSSNSSRGGASKAADTTSCVICCEEAECPPIDPCGHAVACPSCLLCLVSRKQPCPICRSAIG